MAGKQLKFLQTGSLTLLLLLFCYSCNVPSPYFQKQVAIPETLWSYNFQPTFKLEIKDTASQYKMYFLIRHDESFPFANIWFRINEKKPGQKSFTEGKRIQKSLADAEGKWLGTGMGTIWEHKIPLGPKEGIQFKELGIYELKIEQLMRQNPLPAVLNVGLIVEKMK